MFCFHFIFYFNLANEWLIPEEQNLESSPYFGISRTMSYRQSFGDSIWLLQIIHANKCIFLYEMCVYVSVAVVVFSFIHSCIDCSKYTSDRFAFVQNTILYSIKMQQHAFFLLWQILYSTTCRNHCAKFFFTVSLLRVLEYQRKNRKKALLLFYRLLRERLARVWNTRVASVKVLSITYILLFTLNLKFIVVI